MGNNKEHWIIPFGQWAGYAAFVIGCLYLLFQNA